MIGFCRCSLGAGAQQVLAIGRVIIRAVSALDPCKRAHWLLLGQDTRWLKGQLPGPTRVPGNLGGHPRGVPLLPETPWE